MKQILFKNIQAYTALTLGLVACGPQAFVPSGVNSKQGAAGTMNVPPKVDIVLGISANGTMRNIYPGIVSEIPKFLEGLQNSGWDYRFVSIPLSEYHPTAPASSFPIDNAVSVSKYDANYPVGSWLSPFPGADHNDPLLRIMSSLFANSFYVSTIQGNDPVDGHESGFRNQLNFLQRSDVQNNLLRPDALLAVMTLSNGDDRSDWNWGQSGTSQQGSPSQPMSYYQSQFVAVKGGMAPMVKYYSLVAHLTTQCRGYGTWSGVRYEELTGLIGGKSQDICTVPMQNALQEITANLQTVKLSFEKHFLVMGTEPNPGTIQVIKYPNGDASQAQTIPQDPTNGWTYVGYGTRYTSKYAATSVDMDRATGYMVELHGNAILNGNDTADVNYQNAGTVSSH